MAATFVKGHTFGTTEQVTNTKLHSLIESATVSGIVNAELDASAGIVYSKLVLTGEILNADLAGSITDTNLAQITTADKVSCAAITDIIFWENIVVGYENELVYF